MYEPVVGNPRRKIIILLIALLCIFLALFVGVINTTLPQRQPRPVSWEARFLASLGSDWERAEWTRIIELTQPDENHFRALYTAHFNPPPYQPRQSSAPRTTISIENIRSDFEEMMIILRDNFPYLHFAYRHLGVDIDVLEAQFLESIDNITTTTGNIHYTSFLRMLQDDFMRPLRSTGHIWAMTRTDAARPRQALSIDERFSFESMEPGKIAYMGISSFAVLFSQEESILEITDAISGFYASITDYEHLIIDIRRNSGGNPIFFFDTMIFPLMPEDYTYVNFGFVSSFQAATNAFRDSHARYSFVIQCASEMLSMYQLLELYNHELHQLHPTDIDAFRYGFRDAEEIIVPRIICEDGYETIKPVFSGKIWLLIDGGASATVLIADRVLDIGLATLVGNTTSGVTGAGRLYHQLPHSGFIIQYDTIHRTNRHGRSLEYGVDPHIFSDDPLATVLSLIQSEEYRYLDFASNP